MKKTAALRAADRNEYSWNMDYLPYEDGSGYEARFYTCGICTLMRKLGLYDLVPAMCRLDYTMTDAGGTAKFVREYTLASGGPYCDCGYKSFERNAYMKDSELQFDRSCHVLYSQPCKEPTPGRSARRCGSACSGSMSIS